MNKENLILEALRMLLITQEDIEEVERVRMINKISKELGLNEYEGGGV